MGVHRLSRSPAGITLEPIDGGREHLRVRLYARVQVECCRQRAVQANGISALRALHDAVLKRGARELRINLHMISVTVMEARCHPQICLKARPGL